MLGIDGVNGMAGGQQSFVQSSGSGTSVDAPKAPISQERTVTVLERKNVPEEMFHHGKYTDKQLEDAVEQGNKEMEKLETNLRFSVHEKTKQILVKVVDSKTNQVIQELPPEKLLDMCAFMMEKAGLLVDRRG